MPRSYSDGDSKQALVIGLVMFVLLSVLLGLMAWFGYSEQATIASERDKYKVDNESLRTQVDRERMLRCVYQIVTGTGNPKEEKEADEALKGLKNRKEYRESYERELKKITDKGVPWDNLAERPEKNFSNEIQELKAKLAAESKLNKDKGVALDKATIDYQREIAAQRAAATKAEEGLKGMKDDVEKRLKGLHDNQDKVVKEFQDNIIAAQKFAEDLAKLQKEKQDTEAKLAAALKDAEDKVKSLEERVPQIDLLAYDKPKGKITRVSPDNQTAFINLGKADLARPGLTFSIFGVGTYKPNAERKGSVELINVLGDHLSMARITEVKSETRDPILGGDELFNPSWSPGLRVHVAIAGLIDVTGDGRDGTVDFVRDLEKHGVVVDAYLDTRDVSVKGRGIERGTNFLIMGKTLEFGGAEIKKGDLTDKQKKKLDINAEAKKMYDEAVHKGVTVVEARTFMALMGFKLSRKAATLDDINSYLMKKGPEAGGDKAMPDKAMPDKKGAMDKKAPDKKEEK